MQGIELILLILGLFIFLYIGYKMGSSVKDHEWSERLPGIREESIKKSRAVLSGQFSEQLAPYLPGFPFSPTECRFLGKPVDLIVFKGLDSGDTKEIIFLEVKTGESQLSTSERRLKEAIDAKKVSWVTYRPDNKDRADLLLLDKSKK